MVPMAWLSSLGSLTLPSSFSNGFGLKFTLRVRNCSIRAWSLFPPGEPFHLVSELKIGQDILDVV